MEDKKEKTISYYVDDEIQQTEEKTLTARQILEKANINPGSYYLVQLVGDEKKSYKDSPDAVIHMHPKMRFIAIFIGETPVSGGI